MNQHKSQRLLVPVDLSEHSGRAIQFAGYIGACFGPILTGVTLLHVTPVSFLGRHIGYIDFREEDLKQSEPLRKLRNQYVEDEIKPFMDVGEKMLREAGVKAAVEKLVVDGDPAHEVVRVAEEGGFTGIVMGRRGLSELKVLFLGSVTSKVIGHSPCNVFVVEPESRLQIKHILVATDGSKYSEAAALAAINLAKCVGAELTAISVAPYELGDEFSAAEEDVMKIKEDAAKEGLSASGLTVAGKPYERIVAVSKERNIDLIVVGSHGRTGLERLIMGSVAERVIILSTCAVLVTRLPREA